MDVQYGKLLNYLMNINVHRLTRYKNYQNSKLNISNYYGIRLNNYIVIRYKN